MTESTHFHCEDKGNHWLLRISAARLDAPVANQIIPSLKTTLGDGVNKPVILDLSAVEFMDSTGLGTVVLGKKLSGKASDFRVVGASGEVSLLFELTHMQRILSLYPDLGSATADLT